MNEPKFKVGDKVIVKRIGSGIIDMELIGKNAVITRVDKTSCRGSQTYGIDLDGGIYWFEQMLEAVPNKVDHKPQKIVITTDGKTTLARLYEGKKVVKTAEAHCSPDDTFDFSMGANLAMERLIGKATAIQVSAEIPKEITDKFETIKATGKALLKALEEFKWHLQLLK